MSRIGEVMASNQIASIETVTGERDGEALTAIMVALNVRDPRNAPAFIQEVAETFKNHRMCSPPETAGLLVTIIGKLTAEEFREHWRTLVARDPILASFMGQMKVADVMQGTPRGEVLSAASHLD